MPPKDTTPQDADVQATVNRLKEQVDKLTVDQAKLMADFDGLKAEIAELRDTKAASVPDDIEKRLATMERRVAGSAAAKEPQPGRDMQYVYHRDGEARKVTQSEAAELLKDKNWADSPAKHKAA